MAESLPAPASSVTLQRCRSSLNSIDKSCVCVFAERAAVRFFSFSSVVCGRSETQKVAERKQNKTNLLPEVDGCKLSTAKIKIISRLLDIKCSRCLVCIAFLVIIQHTQTHSLMFFI